MFPSPRSSTDQPPGETGNKQSVIRTTRHPWVRRPALFPTFLAVLLSLGFCLVSEGRAQGAEQPKPSAVVDPEVVFFGERRFVDNGDGTVTDLASGLMWLRNADFLKQPVPLEVARQSLRKLNQGKYDHHGYTNWRLPTIKEFQALTDRTQTAPALSIGHPFLDVRNGYYWSSSGGVNIVEYAWLMDITYGIVKFDYPSYCNFQHVWPVRDVP